MVGCYHDKLIHTYHLPQMVPFHIIILANHLLSLVMHAGTFLQTNVTVSFPLASTNSAGDYDEIADRPLNKESQGKRVSITAPSSRRICREDG